MSSPVTEEVSTARHLTLLIVAALLFAAVPAFIGTSAVTEAAARIDLARSANPYVAPSAGLLLYGSIPLVVLSACILFTAPGLLIARALGQDRTLETWVLSGFLLTIPILAIPTQIVELFADHPLRGRQFAAFAVVITLLCALVAFHRATGTRSALSTPGARSTLVALLLVPLILLIGLAPKFHWESLNGDGAHALETLRLLLHQPLPFWDKSIPGLAMNPGMTSMLFAYPGSWFVRLFGEVDAAARLPLVLYVSALLAAILSLAQAGTRRRLDSGAVAALALALVVYAIVLAFNATYSPYSADIAMPATQDTLLAVALLGFILAFITGSAWLLVLAAVESYLSLPSALPIIGLWVGAALLTIRPRPWRAVALSIGAVIIVALLGVVGPPMVALMGLPGPGLEYAERGLWRYFENVQLTDWRRVLFVVLPASIAPVAILFRWRELDQVARALALVALAYFASFYVQAYISLHHFIPAVLFLLAAHWRFLASTRGARRGWTLATVEGALIALALSLPTRAALYLDGRELGSSVVDLVGGYDEARADQFRAAGLLQEIAPQPWTRGVPDTRYGEGALVWNRYARRNGVITNDVAYVLQRLDRQPPRNARLVARSNEAALYVLDERVFARDRLRRPPVPAGSPLYRIPRETLFRLGAPPGGPRVVNVPATLRRLRARLVE